VNGCLNLQGFSMVCLVPVRNWRDSTCLVALKMVLQGRTCNDDFNLVLRAFPHLQGKSPGNEVAMISHFARTQHWKFEQQCCRFLNRFKKNLKNVSSTKYCVESLPVRHLSRRRLLAQQCWPLLY